MAANSKIVICTPNIINVLRPGKTKKLWRNHLVNVIESKKIPAIPNIEATIANIKGEGMWFEIILIVSCVYSTKHSGHPKNTVAHTPEFNLGNDKLITCCRERCPKP